VKRRASQNKAPLNDRISIDLDMQNARLRQTNSDTLTWNVVDEAIPRFGRSQRFDNSIYNVVQTTNIGTVLTSTVTLPAFSALYFTAAAHITQFASFASVFDQYRIMDIEVWLAPATGASTTLGSSTATFASVIDYDDSNTPALMSQLYQYENVIMGNTRNGHYRKFRPHVASAVYNGAFGGFENQLSPWIDVASSNVQHYGLKMGIEATIGYTVTVQCYCRIWCQFRNVF
jgi:hypothetical protein